MSQREEGKKVRTHKQGVTPSLICAWIVAMVIDFTSDQKDGTFNIAPLLRMLGFILSSSCRKSLPLCVTAPHSLTWLLHYQLPPRQTLF